MKFDVEMLKKHRFWILLGLSVLLVLPSSIALGSGVSCVIAEKKARVDAKAKELKNKTDVKGTDWIDIADKKAKNEKALETKVWAQAWRVQEPIFTFPEQFEARYPFRNGW